MKSMQSITETDFQCLVINVIRKDGVLCRASKVCFPIALTDSPRNLILVTYLDNVSL